VENAELWLSLLPGLFGSLLLSELFAEPGFSCPDRLAPATPDLVSARLVLGTAEWIAFATCSADSGIAAAMAADSCSANSGACSAAAMPMSEAWSGANFAAAAATAGAVIGAALTVELTTDTALAGLLAMAARTTATAVASLSDGRALATISADLGGNSAVGALAMILVIAANSVSDRARPTGAARQAVIARRAVRTRR